MLVRSTRSSVGRWSSITLAGILAGSSLGAAGCDRRSDHAAACTPEPRAAAVASEPLPAPASALPASAVAAPAVAAPTTRQIVAAKPAAPEATEPKATRLRVKRLVLAEGVDGREPIGPRSAFRADEMDKVYAFVEVDNPERLGGAITVSFEPPDGPEIGNVRLAVGATSRWRTWAFSRAVRVAGEWSAVVRDESGHILAREPFLVTL